MNFQAKHADFAAKLVFILVVAGLIGIAFLAGGVDFRGYYGAALVVVRGGNPYDYDQLAPILKEVTGFAGNNPYFYPPWFSFLFVPLTLLPFQAARLIWLLLNGLLFYASLYLIKDALEWHIDGWRKWTIYLGAVLLFGAYCLRSEQAGILLLFCLSVTLVAVKRRLYALAGLALVLFASKPQATLPAAIIIALWLFYKQRRSFWHAALWTILLTILSTLLIPGWWRFDRTGFGVGLAYELDGPDQIAAERLLSTVYDSSRHVLHVTPPLQYLIVAGVALGGLALIAYAWRYTPGLEPLVSATLFSTLLVTPYALQYDYVVLTLPFMWMIMNLPALGIPLRWMILALLALSMSVLIWQTWSYQGYLQLLPLAAAFTLLLGHLKRLNGRNTSSTIGVLPRAE